MAIIVPPFFISGAASRAMRTKEWHDTSIALAKPAAEQLSSPPCRSSLGAKAIECTRMSSSPQVLPISSNTASSWPSTLTSSGRNSGARKLAHQRLDIGPGLVVEVGDGQLGAEFVEGLGAAVGDRAVVGDADDQGLAAGEHRAGNFNRHLRLSNWPAVASGVQPSTRRVCRAIISSSLVGSTHAAVRLDGGADARPCRLVGRCVQLHAQPGRVAAHAARGSRRCSRRCRR